MEKINIIIEKMEAIIADPKQVVKEFKAKTGKKVIGCLPIYCPEEIVHAAGMLPIGIWGGQVNVSKSHAIMPSFACSIMQSVMELGLSGVYDDLDGVIIPAPCDTLKSMTQNWPHAIPNIPSIPVVYPHVSHIEGSIPYLVSEFQFVKERLEDISGQAITDEALHNSINIYNLHRQTMREFVAEAAKYPEYISPLTRHIVIKSSYFMEKGAHTESVQELITLLKDLPEKEWLGKKVILTGIMAEPNSLLELFIDNNLAVVADDLAQESRQFRTDVPEGGEPLTRLARQWQQMEGCSLVYDPEKKRTEMLLEMAEEKQADGIVVCLMKFCEPEEFDFPIMKKAFEKSGIPYLYLEIDQQMNSVEQLRTRIQSFTEMLRAREGV